MPLFPPTFGLLLHGSNLEDLLAIGVAGYLLVMFGLSRLKARQIKRRNLKKTAGKEKALHVEEGPKHNDLA